MLLTKACPRCQGDMSQVHDVGETYFSCLQCGFVSYGRPESDRDRFPTNAAQRQRLQPADRAAVRRRQLRRRAAA